jgi:hypothetical protein
VTAEQQQAFDEVREYLDDLAPSLHGNYIRSAARRWIQAAGEQLDEQLERLRTAGGWWEQRVILAGPLLERVRLSSQARRLLVLVRELDTSNERAIADRERNLGRRGFSSVQTIEKYAQEIAQAELVGARLLWLA